MANEKKLNCTQGKKSQNRLLSGEQTNETKISNIIYDVSQHFLSLRQQTPNEHLHSGDKASKEYKTQPPYPWPLGT